MHIWRAPAARFALALTCVFAATAAPQERRLPIEVLVIRKMPNVLWLDAGTASATIQKAIGRAPRTAGDRGQPVIAQSPASGGNVSPSTPVTITFGKPKLRMEVSTYAPQPNQDVEFKVSVDPPPPPSRFPVAYRYEWGDGSQPQMLATPVARHRFPAGQHVVNVIAVVMKRWSTESASATISVAPVMLPPRPMPDVRWLDSKTAYGAILKTFDRRPAMSGNSGPLVLAQSPDPGADVSPRTPLSITFGMPKLVSTVSNTTPTTSDDVRFELSFDPPPPPSPPAIEYHYSWGDGSPDTTGTATVTRRFNEGNYTVTPYAVIAGRWRVDAATTSISVKPSPPRTMPDVRWLDVKTAEIRIREAVGRVPTLSGARGDQLVIAQSPDRDANVFANTPLTVTLGKPALQVKVSNQSPKANEPVSLDFAIEPPPPPGLPIEYHVAWDQGGQDTVTSSPATHVFTDARAYTVTAYAHVGRWQTDPVSTSVSVAAVVPPPPQPEPPSTTTAETTATGTTATAAKTTGSVPATKSDAEAKRLQKELERQRKLLRWLAALLIAASLLVIGLIVRAFKPPPSVPPSSITFRHGLRDSTYTIDNADGLRGGVNVRLRSGIRSMVVHEGGSDG